MYKSTDGGKHWSHIGLKSTQRIGAVIIDPKDPNRVFVAAFGHTDDLNHERGIFRTTDGGSTWQKILYLGDDTAAINVFFDQNNPNILFGAMWKPTHTPEGELSNASGRRLYKSINGGSTWVQLEADALPNNVRNELDGSYRKCETALR